MKEESKVSAVVKVSKNFFIPEREIKYYCGYHSSNAIKREVNEKRKQGLVIDVTSGRKIMSVIFLRNGEIVLTNVSIETIHSRIQKSMGGDDSQLPAT